MATPPHEFNGGICSPPRLFKNLRSLLVRPIRVEEKGRWKQLMAEHHYLGFQALVGHSLMYVAVLEEQWVALLGWGASAFKVGARDRWIGWTREQQWKRLRLVVNNQRFLILPGVEIPNLASRVLALNTRRLSQDWQTVYGSPVLMAETFVDTSRFRGTCYLAAGWLPLGQTRGYGRSGGRYYHNGAPKTILVRPLRRAASRLLSAPFLAPELMGEGKALVDLNTVRIEAKGGLIERLATLIDPRKKRGIRHKQVSILAVAVCACLSGAKSFVAMGQWAGQLSQDLLKRLECRVRPGDGKRIGPSEPTLRRTLQSVDAEQVDAVLGEWLSEQCPQGDAIAFDGKTLRGSTGQNGKPVHLVAAVLHKEGVVIAQQAVSEKSNEITAAEPLLKPLNLEGKVVTADAMHTQVKLARLLKKKKADYVLIAKDNQPTLRKNIEDLELQDFSPSVRRSRQRTRSHRDS